MMIYRQDGPLKHQQHTNFYTASASKSGINNYADDVTLLGANTNIINKQLDASKEPGLEVNVKETKYTFMCHH